MTGKIITIESKKDEKFLRHKTEEFDFKNFSRKDVNDLISRMRKAMHQAQGIGLSANQIGLDLKLFVAEITTNKEGKKLYAIFNPKIEKASSEKISFEEGCLSIPLTYGEVERPKKIVLSGYDKNDKPIKIKAWGLLARVFQHEMDHLNGMLFTDRAKSIHKTEMRKNIDRYRALDT